ncbi:ABC-three component system middle component 8 [Sporosarcina sp. FSL W8-0480]|uniref:ABC-three component system middle component 8 n=1 Tax=Sporosarcina sp. FSL W8-0480 TaxID=2954701 RepID=UPI00130EEAC7
MLLTHKYMDLEKSVLKMSSEIIKEFSNKESVEFEYLYKSMEREFDVDVNELFIPSLILLHALGKLDYRMSEDLLEWIQ